MRPLILLIALFACTDDLADKTQEAARRATKAADHLRHQRGEVTRESASLAHAEIDFEYLRDLRVKSLRLEHSVISTQPIIIVALTGLNPLTPAQHVRLDENLVIFRQRLATTRDLIEQLQYVPATQWEDRDEEVAHAMAGLMLARDASWHAVQGKRDDKFPES